MSPPIPRPFIDTLLERIDIADWIGRHVKLTKRGNNHTGICPFHAEKTPSFSVQAQKGFFYCFGCNASGTVIDFVMRQQHLEFPDAVAELARAAGLEMPHTEAAYKSDPRADKRLRLLTEIARLYHQQLPRSAAADYLKKRHINSACIRQFQLGYAPADPNFLERNLPSDSHAILLELGLLLPQKTRFYSFFRHRLMFPIRDSRGQVVGFGGRLLDGTNGPKYLNSRDSDWFQKRRLLYGLYESNTQRQSKEVLIVEGYMDVISLFQHGFIPTVAALGTAISGAQLNRLLHRGPTIVCFDGDNAGQKAAWRALEVALPLLRDGQDLRFLKLPEAMDPDNLIHQKGVQAWRSLIEQAQSLEVYLLLELQQRFATDSIAGRTALMQQARELLQDMKATEYRRQLALEINKLTQSDNIEWLTVAKAAFPKSPLKPTYGRGKLAITAMRIIIALLLQRPSLALHVTGLDTLAQHSGPGSSLLQQILRHIKATEQTLTAASLYERLRSLQQQTLIESLLHWEPPVQDAELQRTMLQEAIDREIHNQQRRRRQELLQNAPSRK